MAASVAAPRVGVVVVAVTKKPETDEVQEFANPNGIPDWRLQANEARLWLLSQAERRHGATVEYDEQVGRWQRAGIPAQSSAEVACDQCGKRFTAKRASARWCSESCKQRGARRRVRHAKTLGGG